MRREEPRARIVRCFAKARLEAANRRRFVVRREVEAHQPGEGLGGARRKRERLCKRGACGDWVVAGYEQRPELDFEGRRARHPRLQRANDLLGAVVVSAGEERARERQVRFRTVRLAGDRTSRELGRRLRFSPGGIELRQRHLRGRGRRGLCQTFL